MGNIYLIKSNNWNTFLNTMLTHQQVWTAIDALATRYGLSVSGLAKSAGLDSTTFNKSKRVTTTGKERWPSTESLAKVLESTGASLDEFFALIQQAGEQSGAYIQPVPLIGMTQAGTGGFFDDGGLPTGGGWDQIKIPNIRDENAYALEVIGDSMEPLYREGDLLVVSPNAEVRRGDRVVVKTHDGEVTAKTLERKTAQWIELASMNPEYSNRKLATTDVEWIARIIWASQ